MKPIMNGSSIDKPGIPSEISGTSSDGREKEVIFLIDFLDYILWPYASLCWIINNNCCEFILF